MKNTVLVPKVTLHASKNSSIASKKKFIERSRRELSSIDSAKISENRGLEHPRNNLHTEGVLKRVSDLITNSQRTDSLKHYESAWGKWVSWSNRREVCHTRCDISPLLNFLAELLEEDHNCNTIGLHRSTLSPFHNAIQGIKISDHPRIRYVWSV